MNLIDRLMLLQAQPAHQEHHIQTIREPRQGQSISLQTAVGALRSLTVGVRATVAGMHQFDDPFQRYYGTLRQGDCSP